MSTGTKAEKMNGATEIASDAATSINQDAPTNNIDMICFKAASDLAKDLDKEDNAEKAFIDSLSVVQNEGVFALFVYLKSKIKINKTNLEEDGVYKKIRHRIFELGKNAKLIVKGNEENIFDIMKVDIVTNLDKLFFFMDLCERTLVYTKYLLKSQENPA